MLNGMCLMRRPNTTERQTIFQFSSSSVCVLLLLRLTLSRLFNMSSCCPESGNQFLVITALLSKPDEGGHVSLLLCNNIHREVADREGRVDGCMPVTWMTRGVKYDELSKHIQFLPCQSHHRPCPRLWWLSEKRNVGSEMGFMCSPARKFIQSNLDNMGRVEFWLKALISRVIDSCSYFLERRKQVSTEISLN